MLGRAVCDVALHRQSTHICFGSAVLMRMTLGLKTRRSSLPARQAVWKVFFLSHNLLMKKYNASKIILYYQNKPSNPARNEHYRLHARTTRPNTFSCLGTEKQLCPCFFVARRIFAPCLPERDPLFLALLCRKQSPHLGVELLSTVLICLLLFFRRA